MKKIIGRPMQLRRPLRRLMFLQASRTCRFRRVLSTLTALLATAAIHADLYVTRGGSGAEITALFRFNEVTGAFINQADVMGAEDFAGVEAAPDGNVFVLNNTLGHVQAYRFSANLASGGVFGPEPSSLFFQNFGLTVDAHNNVLVSSEMFVDNPFIGGGLPPGSGVSGIFKLDAVTGAITSPTPFATPGGFDLQYGPNGNLFVSNGSGVQEFDGVTGAFIRTVVAANGVTLIGPTGIGFGPDGDLYVASSGTDSILRFHESTLALDTFVPSGTPGLSQIRDIDFGPDGNLYVASFGAHTVLRFNGADGSPLGEFTASGASGFRSAGPEYLSFTVVPETRTVIPIAVVTLMITIVSGRWGYRKSLPRGV